MMTTVVTPTPLWGAMPLSTTLPPEPLGKTAPMLLGEGKEELLLLVLLELLPLAVSMVVVFVVNVAEVGCAGAALC